MPSEYIKLVLVWKLLW